MDFTNLDPSWRDIFQSEIDKNYFQELSSFIDSEYNNSAIKVYPEKDDIFNAFKLTPFESVKVVILGQDPYHGPEQAMGLSFSVQKGVRTPPSLRNIFKEIESDLGQPSKIIQNKEAGDLTNWAEQGVLLLNSILTVRAGSPGSHQNSGWEKFTDNIINQLTIKRQGIVYFLWGKYAQNKAGMIDESRNLVLKSAHPSPFSAYRGFFGSNPFSKTNDYLASIGEEKIEW